MLRLVVFAIAAGLVGTYVFHQLERRRLELVAQIRAAFLALQPGSVEAPALLKEVHLRNAAVHFRVPQAWAEEYRGDDSGRFQALNGSGRVLDVSSSTVPASPAEVADVLRARTKGYGLTTVETLPSGDVLLKALSEARGGGERTVCFVWLIGRPLSTDRLRVASFRFSAPLATAHDVLTRNEVVRVEGEVRAARLA